VLNRAKCLRSQPRPNCGGSGQKFDFKIDWVVVLRPSQHKIGHFGDVPQANLLAWYGTTKPNTTQLHIHHHNHFTVRFPGLPTMYPSELVPEENFWTLCCKGRLTEADTPTIRLGVTPSGLTSAHLHHPPHSFYMPDALPAAQPTVSKHWRQLVHSDYGEDARVLLNGVTCTISVPPQLHIHQSKKCTTTQNKHKITKVRFSRLLQHPAWKQRGPILVSVLHKFVTFLLT